MANRGKDAAVLAWPPRPANMLVVAENIPLAIRARSQWICWRWTWKDDRGKWDKPPFDAKTGGYASSTDQTTWASFETALAAYGDQVNRYSGIGYVFSGEPDDFVGIDLDHCRDLQTGIIQPWNPEQRSNGKWHDAPDPQRVIDALNTYAEISPSGTGVKLLVRGELQRGGKAGDFEVYANGRYFTITGHKLETAPSTITECNGVLKHLERVFFAERASKSSRTPKSRRSVPSPTVASQTVEQIIAHCRRAANRAKFEQLWSGDISAYPSQSEAELALCSIVGFYTGPNQELIDAVMRQSGLHRDKWDEVHAGDGCTYGQMTIAKSLAKKHQFFCGSSGASPTESATYCRGNVQLIPTARRKTASKLTVTVEVRRDGTVVDELKVSDTISNRTAAAKRIAALLPDEEGRSWPDETLTQILLAARTALPAAGTAPGSTIRELLAAKIPEQAGLVYRTLSGKAFSETVGEMSRASFVERFTSNPVLDTLVAASDAPVDDDGVVNRVSMISRLEKELKLLWADLLSSLPTIEAAEIGRDSTTAASFRAAVIACWSKLTTMSLIKARAEQKSDPVQLANRCSLISRVQRMIGEDRVPVTWAPVQEGFSAWVRANAEKKAVGEVVVYLGMRWELATQIGVALPSVSNQTALRRLGKKFGVVENEPKVSDEADRGNTRLVVLTKEITEELLYLPTNEHLTTSDDR